MSAAKPHVPPKLGPRLRLTGEERRARIVEAASKLFAEKGFRGTTTRELAAAVGVTEPVLYEHFKTKRDLYAAIIEAKAAGAEDFLTDLSNRYLAVDDDEGFFTELGRLIVHHFKTESEFERLQLFSNLENHELKDLFHEMEKKCNAIIAGHIRTRVAAGAMRDFISPEMASHAFFGMFAHYCLSTFVFGFADFGSDEETVVRDVVSLFLGGLCRPEQLDSVAIESRPETPPATN